MRSRVLVGEMTALRPNAQTWWRSHYTEKCRCSGCSGQETDILAVFEDDEGKRFAIHFEVKQPNDRFPAGKDQATNYMTRAACWVDNPPKAVVPHEAAVTCLVYSESRKHGYGANVSKFDIAITFEEIREAFPAVELPSNY